ncbi:patatin-like phospholipase family protein [Beggiatoa leptomitoformis]|uniref:BamA/TamA family outer membrane protein n=1 Tax=Beggiatoa leptomitoformis TaxID=288004 RepID=A0A2N9YIX5_9GAMM|nr:patatin-like phospholipase family protein [Beggiatoa leptomitoformis]AUI70305.1 BamA/TamA family outer membrane protein [Beggiatoa leptomitoformis]QGX03615.1 BamA/TamA family outer membrane protein [Beggiatoa leptomitoformis]
MTVIRVCNRIIYLCLLCAGLGQTTLAAESSASVASSTAPPHPKIGIALSGGGARGMAHIGVLKALEELHVPIDYIAGTSMGSVVGGLYASGLTTNDLDKAAYEINWAGMFRSEPDREQLTYREKQNQRRLFNLEAGVGAHGLSVPSGFIGAQDLFLNLRYMTQGINVDHFDQLPIPFKAVATDLNSGEAVLLEKGDLALALRASMAVPFAFSPVEIDGRVLVDGGILDNIPTDVVRQMGANIVIAVNIETPLEQIEANSSFLTVAKQSLYVSLIQNSRKAMKDADMVIIPDIAEYGATDFAKAAGLIAKGYEATMKKKTMLSSLALSPEEYEKYKSALRVRATKFIPFKDVIKPVAIHFTGNKRTDSHILMAKAEGLVGQAVTKEQIEHVTRRIMSLNEFEQVFYKVEKNAQGEDEISFEVKEKSWGADYVRFGINASTTFDAKTDFNLLIRHERLNINALGGEWINELAVGTSYSFLTQFYQPLDYKQRFFVEPYASWIRTFPSIFKQQQGIGEYDISGLRLGGNVGMNFGNVAVAKLGLQHDDLSYKLRIGNSEELPVGHFQRTGIVVDVGYDSLDDRVFSLKGTKIRLIGYAFEESLGSDEDYQKVSLYFRQHLPIGDQATLMTDINFDSTLRSEAPSYDSFSAGGINLLAGYPEGDIGGQHALVLKVGGLFKTAALQQYLPGDVRLLTSLHAGNAWDKLEDVKLNDLLFGGLGAVVWDSPLGMVLFGTGYTEGGSVRFLISLGNLF